MINSQQGTPLKIQPLGNVNNLKFSSLKLPRSCKVRYIIASWFPNSIISNQSFWRNRLFRRDLPKRKAYLLQEIIIKIEKRLRCQKNGFQRFQIAIRLIREGRLETLLVSTIARIPKKFWGNNKKSFKKILKKKHLSKKCNKNLTS